MARGKTLIALMDDLRAECRQSLNPAHNNQVRDFQLKALQRAQEVLWDDFNWPHLRVERQYTGQTGLRYYDFGTDFDIDRIEKIEFKSNGAWRPVSAGIDAEHYQAYDSDLDQRSWPIRRFRIHEEEQVEVWPISDQNGDATTLEGYFKVTGIRKLQAFIADGDRADLDDRLLVLYAAAEYLAAQGSKDAPVKQSLANKRYSKLRGNLMPRRRFQMFGVGSDDRRCRRSSIAYYRPPV